MILVNNQYKNYELTMIKHKIKVQKSTTIQLTEVFHFFDKLWIWLVVPLLEFDSFLHFFEGFSEHSGELDGHVFHFLFQVGKLLFFLSELFFVVQLAGSELFFAPFYV